jgi:beta-glucosidase
VLDGIRKQFPGAKVTYEPGTNFMRGESPVPRSWLLAESGRHGLTGEYFQGTELKGPPVVTRMDRNVNFDFMGNSPAPGLGPDNFSVRWTGYLVPQEAGTFQLGFTGDDGYRLWLDGKLLVEDWGSHLPTTKMAEVKLQQGEKHTVKIEYFQASGGAVAKFVWSQAKPHPLDPALAAAKDADVVIAVVGLSPMLENEEMNVHMPGFSGGDRTSINLPQEEESLLEAMQATGKPLVVVLTNGSALAVNWAQEHANAILESWYSGEDGGMAIAETLAGINNPAGRLPVTFYKGDDQLPPFEDYSMKGRTYRYFKGQPLYPFGYGLSYSKFTYDNLKLSTAKLNAGDSLGVDVDVKNVSQRDGDEVAELYLGFPKLPGAPIRALRGFARVHLAAGEIAHAHFALDPRDLSVVNEAGDRVVAAGLYQISVGGGQPGTGAPTVQARFSIAGKLNLPE